MPTTEYTLGNNYVDQLSSNGSFLQEGPSAPVSDVYAIEKLPMSDGNFLRVAVVPSIRMLNTTVGSQSYVEFYLPLLQSGTNLGLSQSVTLTGQSVTQYVQSGVTKVEFIATFPLASEGFNSGFFPFKNTLPNGQYTVTVDISLLPQLWSCTWVVCRFRWDYTDKYGGDYGWKLLLNI